MGHAEIAVDALLGVARLLLPDDNHFFTVKASHPANNGRIVAKSAVAANLAPVCKNALDIIERVGPLWMPRQLRTIPRALLRSNLPAQVVQLLNLPQRIRFLPLYRL